MCAWCRLESEAKAREANREKVDDLIKAQAEEQQMEDLGEDAANIKNKRAVKADDRVSGRGVGGREGGAVWDHWFLMVVCWCVMPLQVGYWVPGGAGKALAIRCVKTPATYCVTS